MSNKYNPKAVEAFLNNLDSQIEYTDLEYQGVYRSSGDPNRALVKIETKQDRRLPGNNAFTRDGRLTKKEKDFRSELSARINASKHRRNQETLPGQTGLALPSVDLNQENQASATLALSTEKPDLQSSAKGSTPPPNANALLTNASTPRNIPNQETTLPYHPDSALIPPSPRFVFEDVFNIETGKLTRAIKPSERAQLTKEQIKLLDGVSALRSVFGLGY